jgi:tetratricopeptide (TPR) repeat protein
VAEIRSGLLALLEGLGRAGPVVLVVEDAHQAQSSMLDLLEQAVREARRIPLLVLCIARYDLLDDRPEWGGGLGDSLNLYLEPMTLEDATQLAREAAENLDESAAGRIARHAGGNPFFIIETTGMLRHADRTLPADTDSLPEGLLPPTVQAVIASRIDHLPQEARDLARTASVFARSTFDESELALIARPERKVLELLESEELLARDPERPGVWRFRHGLVRDVAYESLPKRERERLHLRVAEGFSADAATAARYPRSIAYHLERAARAGLDLNPGDRDLAERAVDALAHAGDLALDVSDTRTAADLYGRAMALVGPSKGWGTREASILSNLGESLYWQGEFEASVGALQRALDLAPDRPEIRAQAARFLGDIELSIRDRVDRAGELFDEALAAARELGDPYAISRTLLVAGWAPRHRDDDERARAMFSEALEIARANPDGDAWSEARALAALASLASDDEGEEASLALAAQGLAIAETTRDRFSIATARESVAGALRRLGRFDEALGHADAAVEGFRDLGARWELASTLVTRGIVHRLSGRVDDALRDLREAYRLCRELQDRSFVRWAAEWLARTLADAGDPSQARRVLAETAALDGEEGSDWRAPADAEILLVEADGEGALAKAREALASFREHADARETAALVWWIARVFGEEAAGGHEEVEGARKLIEQLRWGMAFAAADHVAARTAPVDEGLGGAGAPAEIVADGPAGTATLPPWTSS